MHHQRACAAAAVLAGLAAAGPAAGGETYLGASLGASLRDHADLSSTGSIQVSEARTRSGVAASMSAGYRLEVPALARLAIRPELALAYRRNRIEEARGFVTLTGAGIKDFEAEGTVQVLQGFANVWLDADLPGVALTPYIGGGAGPAHVWVADFAAANRNSSIADDADTVFGYQLGGGASYPITDALSLTADYRYTALDATDMENARGGAFNLKLNAHQVSLGLRYRF